MQKLSHVVKQHLIFHEEPIRLATKNLCFNSHNSVVIDEFDVEHGRARIDMVTLDPYLHGYEFKSDGDTLSRLPRQMVYFSPAFEKITIVIGYSHLYEVLDSIPNWWGILVAEKSNKGEVFFERLRDDRLNPYLCNYSLLKLLKDEELSRFANSITEINPRLNGIEELISFIVSISPTEIILQYVKHCLANRSLQNLAFAVS